MIAEEKRARRRAHIADAAMRLFAERGFDEVTVNEAAEAAGVVKATLFDYFPTKESLVLRALDDDLARVVTDELRRTVVRVTGGTPERLSLAAELAVPHHGRPLREPLTVPAHPARAGAFDIFYR
ncbi:TetR family transcriptional regulator [Streptosporangium sp. NPDC049376]|uniref:TetR family transcriptional regulator n=1 Tax=Streptosporangium sp. NPDC049376 TaxID=3366192 RepID=UPI0037926035